jgi:hypothetical protein
MVGKTISVVLIELLPVSLQIKHTASVCHQQYHLLPLHRCRRCFLILGHQSGPEAIAAGVVPISDGEVPI